MACPFEGVSAIVFCMPLVRRSQRNRGIPRARQTAAEAIARAVLLPKIIAIGALVVLFVLPLLPLLLSE